MLTKVETKAEFDALPAYVREAMRSNTHNPHGTRFRANINKAERKLAIQHAVKRAIEEGTISFDLGVEILVANNAYGPKGKAALKGLNQ